MRETDASRRFWWANLVPWLVYLLANLLLIGHYADLTSGTVLICVLLSAGLYPVSGAIRHLALRLNWFDKELGALSGRMLLCVLAGAALVQVFIALVLRPALALGWATLPNAGDFSVGATLGYWINTCIVLGLWLAGPAGAHCITPANHASPERKPKPRASRWNTMRCAPGSTRTSCSTRSTTCGR